MVALFVVIMIFGLTKEAQAENVSAYASVSRSSVVIPVSKSAAHQTNPRANFTLGSQNVDDGLFRGYVEEALPRLLEFEKQIQHPKYDDAKDIAVLRGYVGEKIKGVQQLIESSEPWKQKYYQLKEAANQAVEFLTRRDGISRKAGMALKKAEWPQ